MEEPYGVSDGLGGQQPPQIERRDLLRLWDRGKLRDGHRAKMPSLSIVGCSDNEFAISREFTGSAAISGERLGPGIFFLKPTCDKIG